MSGIPTANWPHRTGAVKAKILKLLYPYYTILEHIVGAQLMRFVSYYYFVSCFFVKCIIFIV